MPTLLESIRFHAYPEVPQTLARLRDEGFALVVASNWDVSLHEVLERTGLDVLLDGVVTSAEVASPSPTHGFSRRRLARGRAGERGAARRGQRRGRC